MRGVSVLLMLNSMICTLAQAPAEGTGVLCIAPVDPPNAGEKSLANPAGGNRVRKYTIQVDQLPPVSSDPKRTVRIEGIPLNGSHLVQIRGDGKIVESFKFAFTDEDPGHRALIFRSLYETWSVWSGRQARAFCKCKR